MAIFQRPHQEVTILSFAGKNRYVVFQRMMRAGFDRRSFHGFFFSEIHGSKLSSVSRPRFLTSILTKRGARAEKEFSVLINNESQTDNLARNLANFLSLGDVVCLRGPVGCGKTSFWYSGTCLIYVLLDCVSL